MQNSYCFRNFLFYIHSSFSYSKMLHRKQYKIPFVIITDLTAIDVLMNICNRYALITNYFRPHIDNSS